MVEQCDQNHHSSHIILLFFNATFQKHDSIFSTSASWYFTTIALLSESILKITETSPNSLHTKTWGAYNVYQYDLETTLLFLSFKIKRVTDFIE